MIYLYNYAGQPWKTQYHVREVMNKLYRPTADGYCGDEDNGQTSAWYVFSAMGFYPVCPATDQYVLGSPLFKKITISFDNGKQLVINAPGNNSTNRYVQGISFNGRSWNKNWLNHFELLKGGRIDFTMRAAPNKRRGTGKDSYPYSFSTNGVY
jgi:predicted alpha-1,2-mannosidase